MSESRYHIGDSQDAAGSDSCDNSREAKSPASALTPRGRGRTSKEFDVDSMPPPALDAQPPIPTYLDNRPACGAPPNSRWGYLPCGCVNDGFGGHVR